MATVSKAQARIEALKEFGRLVLIGAVSGALAAASVKIGAIDNPMLAMGLGTFLTFVGKAWDKYLHKSDSTKAEGLAGF